jgi:hypothetical protein
MSERRLSAVTTMAAAILQQFVDDAAGRPPHVALDSLLAIAERMERDQGGRLTEFQARVFAAFLLSAARLPAHVADPVLEPEWLMPEDAERYAEGHALLPPDAGAGLALTRH